MARIFLLLPLFWIQSIQTIQAQATSKVQVSFVLKYYQLPLRLWDSSFYSGDDDSLTVDVCKLYVSNVQFLHKGRVVWRETNSYHLINAKNETSLGFVCNLPKDVHADSIRFQIGIDSATNLEGVKSGQLDPTNGMYWTWQSGYINWKLEGKARQSTYRRHEYEFHVGGYMAPYPTIRQVQFALDTAKPAKISIGVNLAKFFQQVDIKHQHHIMTPGKESRRLADIFQTIFFRNKD